MAGRSELPAYLSNGLVGLRVTDIPLLPGLATVSGFAGLHPTVEVEAAANAPYPLAGDLAINRVWLTRAPQQAEFVHQAYDFATGELTTRFRFLADDVTAEVAVLTLCSRTEATVVCQETTVVVDGPCQLTMRALVEPAGVSGRMTRRDTGIPGTPDQPIDGSLRWEALGAISECGIAYATDLRGAEAVKHKQDGIERPLATDYTIQARRGQRYRLRQLASLVPSVTHHDPDREAARLVGRAAATGFDALRAENQAAWEELWRGRVIVDADDDRWQQYSDAAFYYLNASVHRASPASTSIFGLAQWHDYHYYYGHVMWDIEAFAVPPLLLLQPDAAEAMLEYRFKVLPAARMNAKLNGRRGLQFAWESGPMHGDESMPGAAAPAWYEDHISLDVALAFAQFAYATGDRRFLRERAAPVLYGVVDWLLSRAVRRGREFVIPRTLGIGERQTAADNDAFTVMLAKRVVSEAIDCARTLGEEVPGDWVELRNRLPVRRSRRSGAVMTHDGFHPREQKGSTPDPLAGFFPGWYQPGEEAERDTIDYFLDLAPDYIGSPMLSPLYGVWAAWRGDRQASARLLQQGYGDLVVGRFLQTLEHLPARYPEKPPAGPFFAHLGALLETLLFGLPGVRMSAGDPQTWPQRRVVLPAGWRRIESERLLIHGGAWRLVAKHGARRALLEPVAQAARQRAAS